MSLFLKFILTIVAYCVVNVELGVLLIHFKTLKPLYSVYAQIAIVSI